MAARPPKGDGVDYRRLAPFYGSLNHAQTVVLGDALTNGVTSAAATRRAFRIKVTADANRVTRSLRTSRSTRRTRHVSRSA